MNLLLPLTVALSLWNGDARFVPEVDPFVQAKEDPKEPAAKKRRPGFTVGRDTTYLVGPLDKEGYIDYEKALNESLREGVTADNNANVLLFKAFGPHPDGAKVPEAFFAWMKTAPPPEKGDYFVSLNQYLSERHKGKPPEQLTRVYEAMDAAMARPWTAKEFPEIADWLKRNDKPLAVAIEASRRSHYYYPLVAGRRNGKSTGLFSALIPGVQMCRGLGAALTCRAMLRVSEKRHDEAWQDLLACHRLGRLVGRGGTLIEGLVSVAIDQIAAKADLAYLDVARLDAKRIQACLGDLQKLPALPVMADKIERCERYMFLETALSLDREGLAYLERATGAEASDWIGKLMLADVNWDPALRNANQMFSRMAAVMRLKDFSQRAKQLQEIDREIKSLRVGLRDARGLTRAVFTANSLAEAKGKVIGDYLICMLVPALTQVHQAGERAEQVQDNLHLAFVLAAYQADVGRYPMKLDALAPKYLATLPQDRFTGKALIYRPNEAGYLLYSVGVNGRDDDGQGYDDNPRGDDLVVRRAR